MRHFLVTASLVLLFAGCNISENKEARIRKLESQIERTNDRFEEIETRIQSLESNADRE